MFKVRGVLSAVSQAVLFVLRSMGVTMLLGLFGIFWRIGSLISRSFKSMC